MDEPQKAPDADASTRRLSASGRLLPPSQAPGEAAREGQASRKADTYRYSLYEELGHGGMGTVYRARDKTLGRDLALKVLTASPHVDPQAVERFEREAHAAAALDHPNIIHVLDVGTLPDGGHYYTMDLLRGEDLAEAILRGHLSLRDAVEAIRQVSLALFHAHQKGILHRDIKPGNIFLRRDTDSEPRSGSPTVCAGKSTPARPVHALLLDFGLAKLAESDLAAHAEGSQGRRSMQSLTRSGDVVGTPAYMAPEQTHGARDVDERADIYGLGASLYHALTGRPPFDAACLAELLAKMEQEDPSRPSLSNNEVDADLDTLTLKCLQKDPKDRYQDAGALAEDLKRWLAGETISARAIGIAGRAWRKAKRNKAAAIPVALLVLGLLGSAFGYGGRVVYRKVRLVELEREAREKLASRDWSGARTAAEQAMGYAPEAALYRALRDEARNHEGFDTSAAVGREELARYERARDETETPGAPQNPQGAEQAKQTPAQLRAQRENGWVDEARRSSALQEREDAWAKAVVKFTEALTCLHDEPGAMAALAELYWDKYERAEHDRDSAGINTYEPLVVKYGGAEYAARVRCEREVKVRFRLPEGFARDTVEAYLYEYRACRKPPVVVPVPYDLKAGAPVEDEVARLCESSAEWEPVPLAEAKGDRAVRVRAGTLFQPRLFEANRLSLQPLPGEASVSGQGPPHVDFSMRLSKGSYLLSIPAGQGVCETRYPFLVSRDVSWEEECELSGPETPPIPPGASTDTGTYWLPVPAGPYRAGGDAKAHESPPRQARVIRVAAGSGPAGAGTRGYFLARFKVTARMYLAYLNDTAWHDPKNRKNPSRDIGAFLRVPRRSDPATKDTADWERDDQGRIRPDGDMDWPVTSISWSDSANFCAWLTDKIGGGEWTFALPTEDEWEKAARGPDGRYFPWGDSFDRTFCRMTDSRCNEQETPDSEPFGLFPIDESPFGVRDMAGVVGEWTATVSGTRQEYRILKGGSWGATRDLCRSACRFDYFPSAVDNTLGFRVAAHRAR